MRVAGGLTKYISEHPICVLAGSLNLAFARIQRPAKIFFPIFWDPRRFVRHQYSPTFSFSPQTNKRLSVIMVLNENTAKLLVYSTLAFGGV
jgi:hypothetical protein